jgi:hypothetical protein
MVGGTVIGLARKPGGETMLHVRSNRSTDQVCVDVLENRLDGGGPIEIRLGDQVWWQFGFILWTPASSYCYKCGEDFDIQLKMVGHTYSSSHSIPGESR